MIRKIFEENNFEVVIADEQISIGENIPQKIRNIIKQSDIRIVILPSEPDANIMLEIGIALEVHRDIVFLSPKGTKTTPFLLISGVHYRYSDPKDIKNIVMEIINNFQKKEFDIKNTIRKRKILATGESDKIEFKSTLTVDIRERKRSREMKKAIAKTIAAFMNSKGGTLLIGIDDDGNPIGLDYDLKYLKNKDNFERTFSQIVSDFIGNEFLAFIRSIEFITIEGKDVFVVRVDQSYEPVFVHHKGNTEFFVRIRNRTHPLNVKEAISYYRVHWGPKKDES
jgi:hypothetical protein